MKLKVKVRRPSDNARDYWKR